MLKDQNVELASTIKYGYIRDIVGYLTGYKSGDRFVYVKPFDPPLPRNQNVGIFPCILIHHGKMTACPGCGQTGHKIGDSQCAAKPVEDIHAFKSYQHPLSNHFPCQLKAYNHTFKSLEHAYFWRMATEMGKLEIAEEIKNSRHAGEAKRLSKEIATEEERWRWEQENIKTMQNLLCNKAKDCEQFRECLLENRGRTLAEATHSKFWATGLTPYITERTAPKFWPGQNMLGVLLMELTQQLIEEDYQVREVNQQERTKDSDDIIIHAEVHAAQSQVIKENANSQELEEPKEDQSRVSQSQCHESRPKNRTPPASRPPRSYSTPYRRFRSSSRKDDTPYMMRKAEREYTTSGTQDIRAVFDKSSKRKSLASSPLEDCENSKQAKKTQEGIT